MTDTVLKQDRKVFLNTAFSDTPCNQKTYDSTQAVDADRQVEETLRHRRQAGLQGVP